jgi:osmotically inducible protein OsmC
MALSLGLTKAGHPPTSLDTTATVELDKVGEAFAIKRIRLKTRGAVPGVDEGKFRELAEDAKKNCIISRALAGVPMELDAALSG